MIARLLDDDCPPFALLRRRTPGRDPGLVELLFGEVQDVPRLTDLPGGEPTALALVPFRQIRERGFEVTDDGTPLRVLRATDQHEVPLDTLLSVLPGHTVQVRAGGFDIGDHAYEQTVRRVVEEEIGAGAGANFVVRRTFEGVIDGYGKADALALFRRLLLGERGAYWTFLVHTGERTLVGASPEVHVRMRGGTVVMNPISGTYRYPAAGPTADGLLDFLADRKETEELSMVVDEELKMMCTVGDIGGTVIGPRLKEMAHLAHTEYELRGRSSLDVREVLRETMFAATVTGSPVENACRVIRRHERGGRGYYAGALALIGRDADGGQTLDSPILIRTADIDGRTGRLRVPVGATLVRGSDPAGEVAETHAKAAGVLTALGVLPAPAAPAARPPRLAEDPRVRAALDSRRSGLAPFWLAMQNLPPAGPPGSRPVLVVDAEDTFTSMLAHLLRSTGSAVTVRRFDDPGLRAAALAHPGPVVLGPGPGDPQEPADPRMCLLRALTAELLAEHRGGLLGVCLGHELLADALGLDLVRRSRPHQGAQKRIDFFGEPQTVGFYSSYTARCTETGRADLAARGVELARDPSSGDVHALRGPGFAGVQFHPESVLTLDGPGVVRQLLAAVDGRAGAIGRVAT
ncbi:anthranilate synthase family protein [Streptomyces sp. ACA25]|uniref:anthranilate synthase family protein n=1 Tax=Streptomyces sp. ACA25 TaxID=3022596 RepID=UPI0023073CCD|nr:anthranilate synthase family protein [Streptomyces sp. ACA25]MDB1089898.1 anthranilate synthase family protein [Streptomyces sp. ACA25]